MQCSRTSAVCSTRRCAPLASRLVRVRCETPSALPTACTTMTTETDPPFDIRAYIAALPGLPGAYRFYDAADAYIATQSSNTIPYIANPATPAPTPAPTPTPASAAVILPRCTGVQRCVGIPGQAASSTPAALQAARTLRQHRLHASASATFPTRSTPSSPDSCPLRLSSW